MSAFAVFRRVLECILPGEKSQLSEVVQDGFERITIPLMVEAARNGDRAALDSLEETGYYLGGGLANLINTFNPQKVVLGDYVTQAYGFLLRVIQKTVQERALRWPREAADIVVALYNRLHPDLILSGHWQPLRVTPKSLPKIASDAEALDRLHREILPEAPDLGAEGFLGRISLSQVTTLAGETVPFEVEIRNLFSHAQEAAIHVVVPQGWEVQPIERTLEITGIHHLSFQVTPPQGLAIRRDRIAVDLTVAGPRFGQQTEALVTVLS